MTQFQWQFDAPSGTYKNHALSGRLYEAAIENTLFMDHVMPVEGFGKGMGETVTMTRIQNITEPTADDLIEGVRISEDDFTLSTKSITVGEIGRAVPYTSLAVDLSHFDLDNAIQSKLRDQLALSMDTRAASAFKNAKVKYAITGATTSNITTNGTFGAASTVNMNVYHVERIRDYLFDTLHCPPYESGDYHAIFRTLGLRGIKDDSAWEVWHQYTDPQAKWNGEVGRLESVRFQESNHNNALGKVGTSSVLGEGVVFGTPAVAMAEAQTPELRAGIPADFGRSKAVAWYGILAMDLIWDTGNAGEARVVHVGST